MLALLQKNYLLVVISVVLSAAIVFILNLIQPQKDEKKVYFKTAISVAIISAALVYIHTLYPQLEEVITSPPPF